MKDFEKSMSDFKKLMSEFAGEVYKKYKTDYSDKCEWEFEESEEHYRLYKEYSDTSRLNGEDIKSFYKSITDQTKYSYNYPTYRPMLETVINGEYNYIDYKFLYDFTIKYGTNIGNNNYILNISTIDLVILMQIGYGKGEHQYNFQIIESI